MLPLMHEEFRSQRVKLFSIGGTVRQGSYPWAPISVAILIVKMINFSIQVGNGYCPSSLRIPITPAARAPLLQALQNSL